MTEERRRPARRKTSIRRGKRPGALVRRKRDPERHTRLGLAPSVRDVLQRYNLYPRKGFGQNFLTDAYILKTILDAAELTPDDEVLEIGPGLGVLTRQLAERARRVVAIEIDRGMITALEELLADRANVELIEGDALALDPAAHFTGPYKLVANLPYYITSPLLRHFFESRRQPTRIVVMVQFEVAERIVAKPGELSLLAISVHYYGVPRIVGRIPATAFYPQPKVDSALLAIDVLPRPAVDIEPEPFFRVVSAGFRMPRKQIHNALAQKIWLHPGEAIEVLNAIGIAPTRRAQTLTLEEWASLAREMQRRGGA